MKRFLSLVICICLTTFIFASAVYSDNNDGEIDLYEVFSDKQDKMKTEVGSRIYKWSMHLPDDAIVYKSERANYFDMSTNSYQGNVSLEVNKNNDEINLEEMLYRMQNQSKLNGYWGWGDKELSVDIDKDESGQKFIRIIKTNQSYDYFMIDEAAEEFRDYIENRIYISNNYIYNLTIRMNGEFYRQHEEMFDKLVSSFKLSFDTENPYIKELSDSVSTTREYKNTTYGWKITMSPYWKIDDTPNARYQKFSLVYSDEELNLNKVDSEDKNTEFQIQEGININLVSSREKNETVKEWANKEMESLKNNYHSEAYEIIKSEPINIGGMDGFDVVTRYKTITKYPYIVHNLYIIGNEYKYIATATMMEDKYNDNQKRNSYEKMLYSFRLDKECLSNYLGKIVAAETLLDLEDTKELKMKRYSFSTEITKKWDTTGMAYGYGDYYYDDYMMNYGLDYRPDVNNYENLMAFDPSSNMRLNMYAGLDTTEIADIISQRVERYLNDNEIRIGLAKITIKSSEYQDVTLYQIKKEYDLEAIKEFVSQNENRVYDLEKLQNEYEYIVKIDKDIYTESVSLPVSNMTKNNKESIDKIWANTIIDGVNYSKLEIKWQDHELEGFNKDKEN